MLGYLGSDVFFVGLERYAGCGLFYAKKSLLIKRRISHCEDLQAHGIMGTQGVKPYRVAGSIEEHRECGRLVT